MKRPVDQAIRLSRRDTSPLVVEVSVVIREETDVEAYDRIVRETGQRFRRDVGEIMGRRRKRPVHVLDTTGG